MRDVGGHDRSPAGWERKLLQLKGRSGTKPGSLLKSQIPIRTWVQWDKKAPGFVEIDLVGDEGGDPRGEFARTLTVADVFTGCTETKAVRNKAQKWVFEALVELRGAFPFPIRGLESDNGSEFINAHLLVYCEQEELPFTRSRSGNKNDGAYVEQKNSSVVRRAVATTATTPRPSWSCSTASTRCRCYRRTPSAVTTEVLPVPWTR